MSLHLNTPSDPAQLCRIVPRLRDTVTLTTWSDNLSCPLRQLTSKELETAQFLCQYRGRWFVSHYHEQYPDTGFGPYVITDREAIEITELDNIQLIVGEEA